MSFATLDCFVSLRVLIVGQTERPVSKSLVVTRRGYHVFRIEPASRCDLSDRGETAVR